MKRIAFISVAAALVLSGVGLYYGAPSLLKEPLLHLNRSLSGMKEKTTTAALHTIHYRTAVHHPNQRPATQAPRPWCCCTAYLRRRTIGWILRAPSPASTG